MLAFGHLIPEAIEAFSSGDDHGNKALLYVVGGFLLMLFVEKIAFNLEPHAVEDTETELKKTVTALSSKTAGKTVSKQSGPKLNSAMILCFAMSIHSFFESAALGISNNLSSASLMSACIALHQPAESLALVVAFLKTDMPKSSIIAWLIGFSLVALAGNITGCLINKQASDALEAVIVAMTAGTFIYVGASEIVEEEFEHPEFLHRFVNYASYILGMIFMFFITGVINKWESSL